METALKKMAQGETSRLIIKPKYAFGSKGNDQMQVPANAVEYTVTLNDVNNAVSVTMLGDVESLERAKIIIDKGTQFLNEGKIDLALKFFQIADSLLSNCGEFTLSKQMNS